MSETGILGMGRPGFCEGASFITPAECSGMGDGTTRASDYVLVRPVPIFGCDRF